MPKTPVCSAIALTVLAGKLVAYEVNDWLSVGGVAAATYQYQVVDGAEDRGRGALPIQLEASLRPGEDHEFLVRAGFAAGDGLNNVSPFAVAPWAADLEDDVQDINGRGWNHLLAAWYRYAVVNEAERSLALTAGVLDSTDYLDANEYANDEYTQFMNEAFVNSGSYGLPSYDFGVAAEYVEGRWSVNGLVMNVGENDDGNPFWFYGVQLARAVENSLGSGNYRLTLAGTDAQFLDPSGTSTEPVYAAGFSIDQEVADGVGVFSRVAWQTRDAAADFEALYSAGAVFDGATWAREGDTLGFAYAYLPGGNTGYDRSQVAETYYRWVFNDYLALTGDLQYLRDSVSGGAGVDGFIFGLRGTVEF